MDALLLPGHDDFQFFFHRVLKRSPRELLQLLLIPFRASKERYDEVFLFSLFVEDRILSLSLGVRRSFCSKEFLCAQKTAISLSSCGPLGS